MTLFSCILTLVGSKPCSNCLPALRASGWNYMTLSIRKLLGLWDNELFKLSFVSKSRSYESYL